MQRCPDSALASRRIHGARICAGMRLRGSRAGMHGAAVLSRGNTRRNATAGCACLCGEARAAACFCAATVLGILCSPPWRTEGPHARTAWDLSLCQRASVPHPDSRGRRHCRIEGQGSCSPCERTELKALASGCLSLRRSQTAGHLGSTPGQIGEVQA